MDKLIKSLILMLTVFALVACNENEVVEEVEAEEEVEQKEQVLTEAEELLINIMNLIEEGLAFDTGSYVKGDIPEGEYVFINLSDTPSYFSEEESSGKIIDNENFDSFGYVHIHEAGNVKTKGALISMNAIKELGVNGAKDLYEQLNEIENFSESAFYKVGTDIEPGEYTIESFGKGYYGVLTGPIGKQSIVNNDNFEGKVSVNVIDGQYLRISRAQLVK